MRSFITATTLSFLSLSSLAAMSIWAQASSSFLPKLDTTPTQEISKREPAFYISLCNSNLFNINSYPRNVEEDVLKIDLLECFK